MPIPPGVYPCQLAAAQLGAAPAAPATPPPARGHLITSRPLRPGDASAHLVAVLRRFSPADQQAIVHDVLAALRPGWVQDRRG